MKLTRQEFILEDHMELIPDITKKHRVRAMKRKAMPRVKKLIGTAVFKAIQNEKYLVESFSFKKEGIKITRSYLKNVDISDEYNSRTINKFLTQKIEVI